jgi:hypothetical protein
MNQVKHGKTECTVASLWFLYLFWWFFISISYRIIT